MAKSNVTNQDIMARLRATLEQGAREDREREREEAQMLARIETAMRLRERFFSARVWPTFEPWEKEEWGGEE